MGKVVVGVVLDVGEHLHSDGRLQLGKSASHEESVGTVREIEGNACAKPKDQEGSEIMPKIALFGSKGGDFINQQAQNKGPGDVVKRPGKGEDLDCSEAPFLLAQKVSEETAQGFGKRSHRAFVKYASSRLVQGKEGTLLYFHLSQGL